MSKRRYQVVCPDLEAVLSWVDLTDDEWQYFCGRMDEGYPPLRASELPGFVFDYEGLQPDDEVIIEPIS